MARWDAGTAYDEFMGRWSRIAASRFIDVLDCTPGLSWLDVGCGTGALLEAILDLEEPESVTGVDPSPAFIDLARDHLSDRAALHVGSGDALPFDDARFDVILSGFALNFMPDPVAALREWKRVVRPDGLIGAMVWDYAGRMGFLRAFWDAAIALDPDVADLDEGERFPICRPEALRHVFEAAGCSRVATGSLEITTTFSGFDDFWSPFLAGQGPAPGYVADLGPGQRQRLSSLLRELLPTADDGSIRLPARAWTVVGVG